MQISRLKRVIFIVMSVLCLQRTSTPAALLITDISYGASATASPDSVYGLLPDTGLLSSPVFGGIPTLQTLPALSGRPINFPNPFSWKTGTTIGYTLNAYTPIEFRLYDTFGNQLYVEHIPAGAEGAAIGYNRFPLTASKLGQELPSSIYFYILLADSKVIGKGKITVLP